MTVAELQRCRPEALEAAAAALLAERRRLADAGEEVHAAGPPDDWRGAAADAARARHARLGPAARDLHGRTGTVAAAVDVAAGALRVAQEALAEALATADVGGIVQALATAEHADRALAGALASDSPAIPTWVDLRHGQLTARFAPLRRRLRAEGEGAMLADLDALEATLRADPGLRLLELDSTGREHLRAAVAVGDIAHADHVAVLVPGFGTTLAGRLAGGIQDTRRVLDRAAAVDAAADDQADSHAGIWFLDYEAPVPGRDAHEVADDDRARQGSRELVSLVRLVDEARPDGVHRTVLGHSYGSVVVGLALRERTAVDDAVVSGSPGLGAEDLGELSLPGGRGYVLEADRDPVADLGWFGRDPGDLHGLARLSTDDAVHRGEQLTGVSGHTSYDDAGSTSLHNQAAVVAGHPEEAVRGDRS